MTMKRFGIPLLLVWLLLPQSVQPQDNPAWIALFNGRDLSGWQEHGQEKWTVEDGEILGEALTQAYGYLATTKTYKNFELRAKFKGEGTGNSGIFYHSTLQGVDIKGVQVEVDPIPGNHTGGLYESGGRGWLVKPGPEGEAALKPGEWNDISFSVIGNRVVTFLNGVRAVDYRDPAPRYFDGVIALQLHSGGEGRMRFKDLYIREIE
jgi:hypothetical protein